MPRNLHRLVLGSVGSRIASGELAPGTVLQPDRLADEFDVSRSVVREALRVLGSIGLVSATQRVGTVVLPPERWNAYDPQLIAWRLEGTARDEQLLALTELRLAAEPLAAELAAQRSQHESGDEMLQIASRMRALGRAGDLEGFMELDIEFHRRLLVASGNLMLAQLGEVVAAVLRGRTELGLMPAHPHEEVLQMHLDVAAGIAEGRPEQARAAAEGIVRRTHRELYPLVDGAS